MRALLAMLLVLGVACDDGSEEAPSADDGPPCYRIDRSADGFTSEDFCTDAPYFCWLFPDLDETCQGAENRDVRAVRCMLPGDPNPFSSFCVPPLSEVGERWCISRVSPDNPPCCAEPETPEVGPCPTSPP